MKWSFLAALIFSSLFSITTQAQSFGYVDSEYILNQMPAYQEAQNQLDDQVSQWRADIEQRYKSIEDLYRQFQAEQVLLTDAERTRREESIISKEREVRDYQKQRFGPEGDLYQKRQQLVSPIQTQIYQAIQTLADKKGIDMIFDRSGTTVNILYANDRLDLTNDVLKELGISKR